MIIDKFKCNDGYEIHTTIWNKVDKPIGVIQLIHGMTSYGAQFDNFATKLNEAGYIAFADDHRSHGNTSGVDKLGVSKADNFNKCVSDEIEITDMLIDKYSLPVQIFAHSYGSFLAQRYIQLASDKISGIILSASAYMNNRLFMGKLITFFQRLFFGLEKPDNLLYKMTYLANDKPFADENMPNAWLSRDPKVVDEYNQDELCNYICSIGFYYSMMRALPLTYKTSNLEKIRKNLPIYIASGSQDPLGGMGERVKELKEMYENLSIENIKMDLFEGARHQLTNDPEKDTIIPQFIAFYNRNIGK